MRTLMRRVKISVVVWVALTLSFSYCVSVT